MANTKSAKKRILTTERNRLQNRFYKSTVRTLTKVFLNNLNYYNKMSVVDVELSSLPARINLYLNTDAYNIDVNIFNKKFDLIFSHKNFYN